MLMFPQVEGPYFENHCSNLLFSAFPVEQILHQWFGWCFQNEHVKTPCVSELRRISGTAGIGGRMIQHFTAIGVAIQGKKSNYNRYTLPQSGHELEEKAGHHQKNKRPQCSKAVLNISFDGPLTLARFNSKLEACPWPFGQIKQIQ